MHISGGFFLHILICIYRYIVCIYMYMHVHRHVYMYTYVYLYTHHLKIPAQTQAKIVFTMVLLIRLKFPLLYYTHPVVYSKWSSSNRKDHRGGFRTVFKIFNS